jgi:hypothetical protein
MGLIAALGVVFGFCASFKHHPEFLLILAGWGVGYWLILVLPFVVIEKLGRSEQKES